MKQLIHYFIAILVFVLWLPLQSKSQVSIELLSSKFTSLENITSFNIRNTSPDAIPVTVKIILSEDIGGNVLSISLQDILIKGGVSSYQSFSDKARLGFYNTAVSNYLKANDKLADGSYKICYDIIPIKGGITPFEYCTSFTVNNLTPLILFSPMNGENICNDRPVFQWQNPLPLPLDAKVKFTLVEILAEQNETEAIVRNLPIANIMDVSGSMLPMPSFIKELKENATYAWQVTIYNNAGIIKKSEIWKFKKSCTINPIKEKPSDDAFRQLKSVFDGNYYLVKDKIRFYFTNSYSTEKLAYSIHDIETNMPIKYYPSIAIHTGVNNIEIDVDDCQGLKKGRYYLLQVTNVHSSVLQMKFQYK